ncbi:hypothetical protein HNR40_007208 [Nonomuraea endophytica]|uniref:Uncharacterized protein n=2 Tax=Nonomuraea endophytica TaxID=714136 RepID=A0A7W8EJM0_9ACTN|nr:hypothetical protein [Nonomuraea endophytica]
MTATPQWIHRTPKLIRRSDPETFLVTCALHGRVWTEQDGRHAELRVSSAGLHPICGSWSATDLTSISCTG